jgi:predicted permease
MPWPWRDRSREIEREIQDHLDLEAEEQERRGLSPEAARRAARLAFGNPRVVREDTREAWGGGGLERLVGDIRYALRLWTRSPGFSIVALLTIALGVGAATALFGQVNAVFWKTLPVARPTELRVLAWTAARRPFVAGPNVLDGPAAAGGETLGSFSYPAYTAMRDGTRTFSSLACWADLGEARPVVVDEQGFAALQFVSGNYFETLAVPAVLGRTLQPHDDRRGAPTAAMISYRYWQRAFGAESSITQRTIRLNGETFPIVGVLPRGFFGMDPSVSPDVVVPMAAIRIAAATSNPLEQSGLWNVCRIVGRLRAGVSDEEARADAEAWVHQAIAAAPPDSPYDPPRLWLIDGSRGLGGLRDAASTPLAVLIAVVGGLLLAACANIAGLLLTRGRTRGREIATRLALGAPAGRIVRQLLTESLVLSLAGGLLGLAVAYALAGMGPALLSQFMPTLFGADRTLAISAVPDLRVLAFAVSLAALAGLLFGVMPALHAARVDLVAMLKETVSEPRASRFGLTGGHAMVAAQTALAVLLLVAAGLFLKTVANLRNADLGFDPRGVLYARVEPRTGGMPQAQRR